MTGSFSGGQLVDTGMHYASRCVNAKGQGFSFNRLTEGQGVPFTMASKDDVPSPDDRRGNPVPAGIRQIIRGIAQDVGYRGMERLVWEYHLEESILPITTTMRQMADVVTAKRSYMMGNLQLEYFAAAPLHV